MKVTDILGVPFFYNTLQKLLTNRPRQLFVDDYVRPKPGERVLDMGCGTGNMLAFFDESTDYVGVDLSQPYIDDAKKRYGDRGTFICSSVGEVADQEPASFDIVIAVGLLHHIDDDLTRKMMETVDACLKPTGRYVGVEPAFVKGQAKVAEWMLKLDRGEYIRRPEDYVELLESSFDNVSSEVRHDLMRVVSYTHCILTGTPSKVSAKDSTQSSGDAV